VRSVALSNACGVVRGLAFWREQGVPSPGIRVKAMEAAKSLEAQP
jgi:hypothetical protein